MSRKVKTYAERSAERPTERQEPWERSMRSLIKENFEAIKRDIPKIGTVGVIKDLEAERQDYFDAFLDERERQAKARLERKPLDAEANRQLEWVENARREPPFQPFKMGSFSQALSLESKERRAAGTNNSQRPEAGKREKQFSPTEALKSAAANEARSPPTSTSEARERVSNTPSLNAEVGQPPAALAEPRQGKSRVDVAVSAAEKAYADTTSQAPNEQFPSQSAVEPEHKPAPKQTMSVVGRVQPVNRRGKAPTPTSEDSDEDEAMTWRVR